MIAKDLPPAKDVQDVLRMVHEHTIYECALPPLFLQAEAEGLIEWVYAGAGRDWLGLTDRGRAVLGVSPEPTIWAGLTALLARLVPTRSVGRG